MVKRSGKKKYATRKKNQRTPRKEMTNTKNRMIIAFFYCLRSIMQVAQLIGHPLSTVKSFPTRATERQSLDNLPWSIHPRILSPQQRCAITRAARSTGNRKMNRRDFRDKYAHGVSLDTGKPH